MENAIKSGVPVANVDCWLVVDAGHSLAGTDGYDGGDGKEEQKASGRGMGGEVTCGGIGS